MLIRHRFGPAEHPGQAPHLGPTFAAGRQGQTSYLSFFLHKCSFGLNFLHMKTPKLWQKFRDTTAWITDLATNRHKLQ